MRLAARLASQTQSTCAVDTLKYGESHLGMFLWKLLEAFWFGCMQGSAPKAQTGAVMSDLPSTIGQAWLPHSAPSYQPLPRSSYLTAGPHLCATCCFLPRPAPPESHPRPQYNSILLPSSETSNVLHVPFPQRTLGMYIFLTSTSPFDGEQLLPVCQRGLERPPSLPVCRTCLSILFLPQMNISEYVRNFHSSHLPSNDSAVS